MNVNNKNKEMLTIKSELKMLTESPIFVIHNDLRGYTSRNGEIGCFNLESHF